MNDYEILLLLDPELEEERQGEIVSRIREAVERGGSWHGHEPWGRRRLAFEIDHKPEGVYHLLTFATEPETLDEVSRVLKITDGVMRHLAVRRVKGATTRPPEPSPEDSVATTRPPEPSPEEPVAATRPPEPSPEEPVAAAAPSSQDAEAESST